MKENIFKCFGISKSDVASLLSNLLSEPNGVYMEIEGKQLLVDITLKAEDNNVFFYEFTREIFEKLNPFIYAESKISLEETALELLKLNKLTIATAESITGGQIISMLIKSNSRADSVVLEGLVTYTNASKINRLNVSESSLNNTAVSVQTSYDMANGLLETCLADFVVATTGYVDSENSFERGLVYIAIGNRERIDVYKNKFEGTKAEIIETAANAALFYLIKKLRKNDFYFNKNEL